MDYFYLSLILLAYLSGSISSAILVCKLFTLPDPTITGSNNPGATNVLRIGGRKAGIATLIGDVAKTLVPIFIGKWLGYGEWYLLWLGTGALIGHCFPVFYKLKGGKGVACFMTLIILILPTYGALALGTWLISAWTFQRSSVASIVTAIVLPVFVYHYAADLLLPISAVSSVVLIRHRKNLERIVKGEEPIIGQ